MLLKRKLITALLTILISSIIICLITPVNGFFYEINNYWNSVLNSFLTVPVYVGVGVILYGIPISLIIDKITGKMESGQLAFYIIAYIFFGILPFFLLWFLTIYSLGIALLFGTIDWIIKRSLNKKHPLE